MKNKRVKKQALCAKMTGLFAGLIQEKLKDAKQGVDISAKSFMMADCLVNIFYPSFLRVPGCGQTGQ